MTTSRAFIPLFARLFVFSFFLLAAILFCLAPPQSKSAQGQSVPAVPAFPGAEGGGAVSIGGRGGRVISVTTLADDKDNPPPGSLREALNAAGPRTVVFKVSGVIILSDTIRIKNPYVTVAGQTAPAPGILLRLPPYNAGSSNNISKTLISIQTHDVSIRYLRLRHGYSWNTKGTTVNAGDNLAVGDNAYNVIIDHVSASWAQDENMSVFATTSPTDTKFITYPCNVTFSRNIIAESFNDHSTAMIMGADAQNKTSSKDLAYKMVDLDLHHNLFINNGHRNPLLNVKKARVVKNIFYNWEDWASGVTDGIHVDFINNYYRPGPKTTVNSLKVLAWRPKTDPDETGGYATGDPSIYLSGNISGITPFTGTTLAWDTMTGMYNYAFDPTATVDGLSAGTQLSLTYKRPGALTPALGFPITPDSVAQLEKSLVHPNPIFSDVGASRRLDRYGQWIPAYDEVDIRLFNEYAAKQGTYPISTSTFLTITFPFTNTSYPDVDNDGMFDGWEKRYKFPHTFTNGTVDDPITDADADGYTNLEEFLNGTIPVRNQLVNGEFSDGNSNWHYSSGITKEIINGEVSMTLPSAVYPSGTIDPASVDLTQTQRYRLSFSIRGSQPYTVAAYIADTAALTSIYMPMHVFTLNVDNTAMITNDFTMTQATDTTSVFVLRFGNAAPPTSTTTYQVWLDNVAIFEIPPTSTVAAAAASEGSDEPAEREEGAMADSDGDTAVGEEANVVGNEETTEDVNNRSLFLPFVSRTEQ